MSTELSKFNELKAKITKLVEPTTKITVTDFASSQRAIEVAKQVKAYLNEVETKRKELVGPLNDHVKAINQYAKDITAPLIDAETTLKKRLAFFADEQEKIRIEEARRADEARRKAEAEALAQAQKEAEELAAKQRAELENQGDEPSAFGSDVEEESIEAKHAREAEELRERLDQAAAVRASQAKQEAWDIDQQKIKNTRKNWKAEIENLDLIPKEFLIISLNEKAALAAHKAGVKIPGVKFTSETVIAIGSKTYVPKTALTRDRA